GSDHRAPHDPLRPRTRADLRWRQPGPAAAKAILGSTQRNVRISGSTRSESARQARGTLATLKQTCREPPMGFWAYLQDRARGAGQIPRWADLIRPKAEETAGQDGRSRAAGIGGCWSGGVSAEAIEPRDSNATAARRPDATAVARGHCELIEK